MIKAGKDLGNLGVASGVSWKEALNKLKKFKPKIVVPGHGKWGDHSFLNKTYLKELNTKS